jgi:hypothetical protein
MNEISPPRSGHSTHKRKWWEIDFGDEEEDDGLRSARVRTGNEILVIDDEEEHPSTRGAGTEHDPVCFAEWTTGSVIPDMGNGIRFEIEDSDDDNFTPIFKRLSDTPQSVGHERYHIGSAAVTTSPASPSDWRSTPDNAILGTNEAHVSEDDHQEHHGDEVDTRNISSGEGYLHAHYTSSRLATPTEDSDDDMPTLSFSQTSQLIESPSTPSSSQNSIGAPNRHVSESRGISSISKDSPQVHLYKHPSLYPLDDSFPKGAEDVDEKHQREEESMARLKEKKRIFYMEWAPRNLRALRGRLLKYRPLITEPDNCWLYAGWAGIAKRTLAMTVAFNHNGHQHKYTVNACFIALLVEGLLSQESISGIINHAWHASHLCGNWWCTNPGHIIAEPGPTNISRNPCFHGRSPACTHTPRCMTERRIREVAPIIESKDGATSPDIQVESSSQTGGLDQALNIRAIWEDYLLGRAS